MSEYLKCPECGSTMVKREGRSEFFGCSEYPKCKGTRQTWEQGNKKVLETYELSDSLSGYGECSRCGRGATRDVMGLCESCAEWYEKQ